MSLRWWEVQSNPDLANVGDTRDIFSNLGYGDPGGVQPVRPNWTTLMQTGLTGAEGSQGNATYHFGNGSSGGVPVGNSGGGNPGISQQGFDPMSVGGQAYPTSTAGAVAGSPGYVAGGAPGAGGAMAGGSWWSNPQVWGAVLGAGSSYLEQQQANRNAQQANQPRPYSNQTTPWGPATSNLEFGMAEALRRYQNQGGGPPGGGGRGGRGGGGGGGGPAGPNTALTPQMQGLLDSMVSRGTSTPDYITSAQQDAAGMISGGGSNPYLQGTYDQASNYRNPYEDQFIQSMMGAYAPTGHGGGSGNRGGASSGHYASSSGGGGGGDTYTPNQWLRESLDGRWLNEGNPEMDALLATMARETSQDYLNNIAPAVDADYIRGGRYGSDSYAHAQAMAAEQFGETLAGQQAQVRYGNYNDERGRMQDSLGLMTQGELGAMQADAQRASSAASAGASRYATDMQGDIANRGLLLDAIRGVSSDDMNRMGLMGQMAGQFGDERLGALNAIPGLEQASWMGPTAGWGAGMDAQNRSDQILLHNQQRSDQQRAQQQANATRRWQMSQEMDNQRFNDLMRWSLATGEAFGQTSGVNTPGQYVPQGSTGAAALQGGIGGYMFGSGLRNG